MSQRDAGNTNCSSTWLCNSCTDPIRGGVHIQKHCRCQNVTSMEEVVSSVLSQTAVRCSVLTVCSTEFSMGGGAPKCALSSSCFARSNDVFSVAWLKYTAVSRSTLVFYFFITIAIYATIAFFYYDTVSWGKDLAIFFSWNGSDFKFYFIFNLRILLHSLLGWCNSVQNRSRALSEALGLICDCENSYILFCLMCFCLLVLEVIAALGGTAARYQKSPGGEIKFI